MTNPPVRAHRRHGGVPRSGVCGSSGCAPRGADVPDGAARPSSPGRRSGRVKLTAAIATGWWWGEQPRRSRVKSRKSSTSGASRSANCSADGGLPVCRSRKPNRSQTTHRSEPLLELAVIGLDRIGPDRAGDHRRARLQAEPPPRPLRTRYRRTCRRESRRSVHRTRPRDLIHAGR
jgi:hypothetical protein